MLLPKHKDAGGWKSTASSRLPARKQMVSFLTRTRLTYVLVLGAVLLFWRVIGGGGRGMDRFYCWGPPAAPMDLSANDRVAWHQHLQTPVLFNHHVPIEVQSKSIQHLDLNKVKSTPKALSNQERILILTPLKDASPHLAKYFELIADLTYPHHLIDLAFLVGDSSDDTMGVLSKELDRLQSRSGDVPFNSAMVVEKDFHFTLSQDVKERHGYKAQGPRRKAMGKARNYLLSTALKPEHSWVYWRDVDIVESPESILEDLIAHDVDIVVPNIWFHRYENGVDIEGRFDYNSWVESAKGLKLAAKLPKDTIIAEGYKEFKTGRTHMALMGDRSKNKDEELNLDGIGGVSILVKGDVHRSGINFPCYAFENQAETEGFAKMAKRAGYRVVGLPNYVVWHIDTAEEAGNA